MKYYKYWAIGSSGRSDQKPEDYKATNKTTYQELCLNLRSNLAFRLKSANHTDNITSKVLNGEIPDKDRELRVTYLSVTWIY